MRSGDETKVYQAVPCPTECRCPPGAMQDRSRGRSAAHPSGRSGKALAYAPVIDPNGTDGIAVVEVSDEAAARTIATNDPAIRSSAGFAFDVCPMPDTMVRL